MPTETLRVNFTAQDRMSGVVKKSSSEFTRLKVQVAAAAVAYVGFRAAQKVASKTIKEVTAAMRQGIEAATEYERSTVRLSQAMRSSNNYSQQSYELYLRNANALQKLTNFTENEILAAEAMLATFKLQPDVLIQALELTLDMAEATGADLVRASILLGKAAVGVTGSLSEYGIMVDKADLATRGFQAVVEEMNKEFGGQARANVHTYAGAIGQIGKSYKALLKEVARFLTESKGVRALYLTMAETLYRWADATKAVRQENQDLTTQVVTRGIAGLIKLVGVVDEITFRMWILKEGLVGTADALFGWVPKGIKLYKDYLDWQMDVLGVTEHRIEKQAEEKVAMEGMLEMLRAFRGPTFFDQLIEQMEIFERDYLAMLQRLAEQEKKRQEELAMGGPVPTVPGAPGGPELPPWRGRREPAEGPVGFLEAPTLEGLAAKYRTTVDEVLAIQDDFSQRYVAEVEGRFAYEWEMMERDYELYSKFVTDKEALDQWLAEQRKMYYLDAAQTFAGTLAESAAAMTQSGMISGRVAQRMAQVRAMVDAFAAATAAMGAMSGIPIVGPALGIIAYGATLAQGLAAVRMIEKQKFHRGGRVPGYGERAIVAAGGETILTAETSQRHADLINVLLAEGRGGIPAAPGPAAVTQRVLHIEFKSWDSADVEEAVKYGDLNELIRDAAEREYL